MHISEGVLVAPLLITGAAGAAAGCGIGLKKMDLEQTPKVAVMSSVFFVASFIHIPIGPTSAHLMLNGLVGIVLGWASFPALLVALLLQVILFQFGGITTLGVNTLVMALPALLCFYAFSKPVRGKNHVRALIAAFFAGAIGILVAGVLVAFCLVFTGEQFFNVAKLFIITHTPVMIVEGVLTAIIVGFLRRVKPALLGGIVS
jgi:cobalt/nickel transport system permease protein